MTRDDHRAMRYHVLRAAKAARLGQRLMAVFEHEQWWITAQFGRAVVRQ